MNPGDYIISRSVCHLEVLVRVKGTINIGEMCGVVPEREVQIWNKDNFGLFRIYHHENVYNIC